MFTEIFTKTKTEGGTARSLAAIALLLAVGVVTPALEVKAAVPEPAISWGWTLDFLFGPIWRLGSHRVHAGFPPGQSPGGDLETASLADEEPPPPPPPPPSEEPEPLDRDTDILSLTEEEPSPADP